MALLVRLFGSFQVTMNGEPITGFRSDKVRALFVYLAVEAGQPHRREFLAGLLWPEQPDRTARANLRHALANFRKVIGDHQATPPYLQITRQTIQFNAASNAWVDVNAFARLLHSDSTNQQVEEAVEYYRGSFLEGFSVDGCVAFDEWVLLKQEQLGRQVMTALHRLAITCEERGELQRAIQYVFREVELDPWREAAHQHLMRLLAINGQRGSALAQYENCRRLLASELGVEPSKETTRLYERIRDGEIKAIETVHSYKVSFNHLPSFFIPESTLVEADESVFIAREPELAKLGEVLDLALTGQGQVAFVVGGPGRGKTTLMKEFTQRAMGAIPTLLAVQGNCNAYSGLGDPYLPFRKMIEMLTGDVEPQWISGLISHQQAQRLWHSAPVTLQALATHGPSLINTFLLGTPMLVRARQMISGNPDWLVELNALHERGKADTPGLEQSALFDQYANVLRALATQHPLLLLIDDMQWADAGSISLLFHLGRRLTGAPILVVCAYRPEEISLYKNGERHPLEKILHEFKRRFGNVWVDLRQADKKAGRRFVDDLLDTEPNQLGENFRKKLFERTEGHPLFTIELLRSMQGGDLVQDDTGKWVIGTDLNWDRLPARVEAVIESRVGQLDESLRKILSIASVEGEKFTAQVIAQVGEIPEHDVLRTLTQELGINHRLVSEAGEIHVKQNYLSRYRFAHALFQSYLYNDMSAGERRLLHHKVGVALEMLYGDQVNDIVVQLAYHFVEAGQPQKAIPYLLRAGDLARRSYAQNAAVKHYQKALILLDQNQSGESHNNWRLEALRELGKIEFGFGRLAEAENHLQEAIDLGQQMALSHHELIRLYHWLGEVLHWQHRHKDKIRLGEEGLALLGSDTESVEAALMNQNIAFGYWGIGDQEKVREFTYRTARFIKHLPYSPELGPAFIHIFGQFKSEKNIEQAMSYLQALKDRATRHQDLKSMAEAHRFEGVLLAERGDLHGAIIQYERAVDISIRIGDINYENTCRGAIGIISLDLGDLRKADAFLDGLLEDAQSLGLDFEMALTLWITGRIAICKGSTSEAVEAFQKAVELGSGNLLEYDLLFISALGRGYLAQGKRTKALEQFQDTITVAGSEVLWQHPLIFVSLLSGLEEAYFNPAGFRTFYRRFQQEHTEIGNFPYVQWFLEPIEEKELGQENLQADRLTAPLSSDWVWIDPFNDNSYKIQDCLEMHATNGRDLWHINLSAPRLLQPIAGDFSAQTVCVPVSEQKPAIGGLLLWKDKENYLRLDRGARGEREISFSGCLENKDVVIGRGRLPTSDRVFLWVDRVGEQVNAFCSGNGEKWFTVGQTSFSVDDPIQIGLHAIGQIDRTIYHGTYPEGTAISFQSFGLGT